MIKEIESFKRNICNNERNNNDNAKYRNNLTLEDSIEIISQEKYKLEILKSINKNKLGKLIYPVNGSSEKLELNHRKLIYFNKEIKDNSKSSNVNFKTYCSNSYNTWLYELKNRENWRSNSLFNSIENLKINIFKNENIIINDNNLNCNIDCNDKKLKEKIAKMLKIERAPKNGKFKFFNSDLEFKNHLINNHGNKEFNAKEFIAINKEKNKKIIIKNNFNQIDLKPKKDPSKEDKIKFRKNNLDYNKKFKDLNNKLDKLI